jgi:protease-4
MRVRTSVLLTAALLGGARSSFAGGPFPQMADRVDSPGRSAVTEDTMESLRVNPANLAFLPAWELRYTGVFCKDLQKTDCGHALGLGTPLFLGLAAGIRFDYVLPPDSSPAPFTGSDSVWATYGLAWRAGNVFSLGLTLEHSYSHTGIFDDLTGVTAGASLRPNRFVALSVVARDFNAPNPTFLSTTGEPILDRSYVGGIVVRPTGHRYLEVGFEGKYYDTAKEFLPRWTGAVDIPSVGRARGSVEVSHWPSDDRRGVVGTVGLELALDRFTAGGGAMFGRGLGNNHAVGEFITASVGGFEEPGLPERERAVKIRLEHTPDARGHVALLRKLWKLADASDVRAIVFVPRADPASSLAHAEEIADAFRYAKAKGKKIICSFEDAGYRSLYTCAGADRVVITPAGGVRYAGLRSQHLYLAELLDKLSIKAEFVRVSDHKSAPEQFTNTHASPTALADYQDFLDQTESIFVRNLSLYRHLPEDKIRAATIKGPYIAEEARQVGWVDGTAYDDELDKVTEEVVGRPISLVDYKEPKQVADTFGIRGRIGLLYLDGDMVDGRSSHVPLLDERLAGSYTMAENIKRLREDDSVRAVVFRIESPGGSSLSADIMWRELEKLAEKKPLFVSMGSVAASGGYYVAAPARRIFAMPLTVTGSIGVFYGKVDLSGLLKRIGVNIETLKTAPRADAESLYRGFTADERHELEHKVFQWYDIFLDRVARGRHMSKAQVDAVARGRVWTGQEAMDRGLVDEMGGLRQALAAARSSANLADDAPVAEFPPPDESLLELALKLAGLSSAPLDGSVLSALPLQVKQMLRAVAPLAAMKDDTPMSRLEWVDTDAPFETSSDDDTPSP